MGNITHIHALTEHQPNNMKKIKKRVVPGMLQKAHSPCFVVAGGRLQGEGENQQVISPSKQSLDLCLVNPFHAPGKVSLHTKRRESGSGESTSK